MTLIAGFFRDGCPILFGDLLVSDKDKIEKVFVFPTVGKISKKDISNGEYSPSHLCQKVIMISPKLAVCWANKKIYASSFINEIISAKAHIKPKYDVLASIYNELCGQGNLSIVGILRNGDETRIFDFECWPVDFPYSGFQYFKAAGSGYATLLNLIPNMGIGSPSRELTKLDIGISTAIHFSTAFLSQEILTKLPLEKLFGVGYEILHPLGADLTKFSHLTYAFWTAKENQPGEWKIVPFPFLSFNYSYCGETLVIRSVRTSQALKPGACKIDSDELHAISPIHKKMNPDELRNYSPPSLNSQFICNIFLWQNAKGENGAYATYGQYKNQKPPIIWKNEFTRKEGIDINIQFLKESMPKIAMQANTN